MVVVVVVLFQLWCCFNFVGRWRFKGVGPRSKVNKQVDVLLDSELGEPPVNKPRSNTVSQSPPVSRGRRAIEEAEKENEKEGSGREREKAERKRARPFLARYIVEAQEYRHEGDNGSKTARQC